MAMHVPKFLKGRSSNTCFFLGGGRCDVCFVPGTFGTSIDELVEANGWTVLEIVSL